MLVNCYLLFLYGVFTVDAVDLADFFDIAVVDCVEIVLVVNGIPNFDTKKYKLYFKVSNILLLSELSIRMFGTIFNEYIHIFLFCFNVLPYICDN